MEDNTNIKYCPECGSQNDNNSDFCGECGYSFKDRADENVPTSPTPKKHNNVIIPVVSIICVAVIAVGVYLYLNIDSGKKEIADVTPATEIQTTPVAQVTAEPTPETTPESPLNKIPDYADEDIRAQYIFPDSDKEMINIRAFEYLNAAELELARNEIYARHGRQFQTDYIQQYFNNRPWYQVNPNYNYDNEDSMLTDIELENVKMIVAEENRRKGE